jgi:murein DD-endopeptidase MepM/ murein hydrolase activator NlpD
MPISKKAFCFFYITILAVGCIFTVSLTNTVTATQSVNLLLEKKFDNSTFVIPDDYFKIERRFKNLSLAAGTLDGAEKIEGRFQNSNLLVAEKILSISPDYVSVNSNLFAQNISGDLVASPSEQPGENKTAGENDLSSLIVIGDNFESFQTLTSSKLYVAKIQNETYVPGYLRGIDFANYSGLHLERGEGEDEHLASDYEGFEGAAPAFGTLLSASYDNAMLSESETSLDMSELDQNADKLPTKDIFKRFSSFKDMNIVVANELNPVEIDCSFLPEKSAPREFNKFHVVETKDSVISIASGYNVTVSELMAANNLKTTALTPGSTLLVPARQAEGAESGLTLASGGKSGENGRLEKSADGRSVSGQNAEKTIARDDTSSRRMLWPSSVSRRVTSRYGVRVHPVYRVKKFHNGIDIGARYGSPIKAAADGVVVYSGWKSYYGRTVIIKHSGDLYTLYAHCSKLEAKKGARVSRGSLIAKVGSTGLSTGPHIHFSVQKSGSFVNPMKYF